MQQDNVPAPGVNEVSTSLTIVARKPTDLSEDLQRQSEQDALALADTIGRSLENRTFLATLDNLGRESQNLAIEKIGLIETRVNAVTRMQGTEVADIPAAVGEMRNAIDQLNPQRAKQSAFGRFLERLPLGKPLLEVWWASGIRQISMRRETIREQIKGIQLGLLGNKNQLTQDSGQLNQLYDFIVSGAMGSLQRSAYTGELLIEKLQAVNDALSPDDPKRDRFRRAIEITVFRVRHMRLIETALQQGLATIDITTDGNGKIAESLEETATLTTAYLTVAMALYQALARQQQAIKALVKAREGTTEVMLQASRAAQASATTVSELYFDPVAELSKVSEAHQNLMSALQTLEDASRTGVVKARQSIATLKSMTESLREKQGALRAGGHGIA